MTQRINNLCSRFAWNSIINNKIVSFVSGHKSEKDEEGDFSHKSEKGKKGGNKKGSKWSHKKGHWINADTLNALWWIHIACI